MVGNSDNANAGRVVKVDNFMLLGIPLGCETESVHVSRVPTGHTGGPSELRELVLNAVDGHRRPETSGGGGGSAKESSEAGLHLE